MTSPTMPTAGEYLAQYLSDFKGAKESLGQSNKKELDVALGGQSTMLPIAAAMSGTAFTAVTGLLGAVTGPAAMFISVGWLSSNFAEDKKLKKASEIHESLQENSKNAASIEDLIQGQQDIIAKHRNDNEGKPRGIMQATGKHAVYLGIMACGLAAGFALATAAPMIAAVSIIGSTFGLGSVMGRARGEMAGQEKVNTMLDRIADNTKDFAALIAIRRENLAAPAETLDPARPKNAF